MRRARKLAVKVRFQRRKGGPWEEGVGVGAGTGDLDIIVDMDGELLTQLGLWQYQSCEHAGFMYFDLQREIRPLSVAQKRRLK